MKYFAPLSSPKQKHLKMKNDIDFYKLSNGKLGAINFNNMIPVPDGSYTLIGTKTQSLTYQEQKYKALLRNQLRWLNPDGEKLRDIASNLYMNRINNTLPFRVQKRCCDFQLLEEKCKEYTKMISTKSFQELEYDEIEEDCAEIIKCFLLSILLIFDRLTTSLLLTLKKSLEKYCWTSFNVSYVNR